jgi:hypothetical protein
MTGRSIADAVAELAEAAADRAVLRSATTYELTVAAHRAVWRVGASGGDFPGWSTVRVDAGGLSFGGVPAWLGGPDLGTEQVIDNMLSLRWLPAARQGWSIPVDTSHPWDVLNNVSYARCPGGLDGSGCAVVGPVHVMRCVIEDLPHVDLDEPFEVCCGSCGNRFDGRLQAAPVTGLGVCQRCTAANPVPLQAATMRCRECSTFQPVTKPHQVEQEVPSSSLQRLAARRPTPTPTLVGEGVDLANVVRFPGSPEHRPGR